MAQTRTFNLGTATVDQLARSIETFLMAQGNFEVQLVEGSDGWVVQARQRGSWRQFIGQDKALQARLLASGPGVVTVFVGQGKWIDKLGVAAVGALWLWPLVVVAGFGAYSQYKLGQDVLDHAQAFVNAQGGR